MSGTKSLGYTAVKRCGALSSGGYRCDLNHGHGGDHHATVRFEWPKKPPEPPAESEWGEWKEYQTDVSTYGRIRFRKAGKQ